MHSLKKLYRFLKRKERIRFFIQILNLVITSVLEVVGIGIIPAFLVYVSDQSREQEVLQRLSELGVELNSTSLLFAGLALILLFFVLKNIILVLLQNSNNRYIQGLQRRIESELFRIYVHSNYEFYLRNNSAKITSNLNTEIRTIISGVINPVFKIQLNVIMSVLIIAALIVAQPLITIFISLVLALTLFIFFAVVRRRIQITGKELKDERVEMLKWTTQAIGSIKEIKTLKKEDFFLGRFKAISNKLFKLNSNYLAIINIPKPLIETVAIFCLVSIIVYCSYSGMSFEVMTSVLILYGAAFLRLMPAFQSLGNNLSTFKYSLNSLNEVMQDIEDLEKIQKQKRSEASQSIPFTESLELRNLKFQYSPESDNVLKGINLKLKKGDVVGLVGRTGCGKTTLVDIILGLLIPSSGDFVVDGKSYDLNHSSWKSPKGYVPQNLYLIDDTILANIALGEDPESINLQRAERVAKAAQLDQFLKELPEGWYTNVGDRGVKLSGGQRQRIGIARALYYSPDILVLDEATSALDGETEKKVIEAIAQDSTEKTMIMIAHRLETLKYCTRIFVLVEGRISEEITYSELMNRHNLIKDITPVEDTVKNES